MSLTKKTIEHEFLFRWNEAGHPQGCHIAYREAVLDDGVEIASRFLDPRPVALDDAPKLAEIGAAINAATLAALTAAQAEADTARAALATVEAERDAAIAERDALIAANATVDADGVPNQVTKRQGKTLMELTPNATHGNLWTAALAAIDAMTDATQRVVMRNYLIDSQVYERERVRQMATALFGMTPEQADQMMIAAAKL